LLAASVDRTHAKKNAKVHVASPGAAGGLDLSGDAIVDFAADKLQLIFALNGPLAGFGPLEERVFGNDVYLKGPKIETSTG
jgi:hypothetical protein